MSRHIYYMYLDITAYESCFCLDVPVQITEADQKDEYLACQKSP